METRVTSPRYEYKFVLVKLRSGWWTMKPTEDYREIIRQHAQEGWRLVQIFAPAVSGYGSANRFELIFERPVE